MDRSGTLADDLRRAFLKREAGEPDLSDELALARRVHDAAQGDPEVLDRIDLELDASIPLSMWLRELPFELADAGRVDEAAALCSASAPLTDTAAMLGARAEILAAAGRVEEASAQADELVARFGDDLEALVTAGLVFEAADRIDRAESLYRHALELAGDDADAALAALDRLVPLLRRTGRSAEAAEVEAASAAFRDALEEQAENLPVPGAELFGPDPLADVDADADGTESHLGPESATLQKVLRRLLAFSSQPEFEAEQAAGLREWFGDEAPGETLEEAVRRAEDESAFAVFVEWLMLDRADPEGRTLVERFLERRRAGLDPLERAVASRLAASHLALYEVQSVREGIALTLLDVLSGVSHIVVAPEESTWIVAGDTFAARLVALDGALQSTGSVAPLERVQMQTLRDRLLALKGSADWATALKRLAPEIARA